MEAVRHGRGGSKYIAKILKYLDAEVARNGYLMAEGFTGADIQMSYVVEIARMGKLHEPYAALEAWMARLEQRPAYKRAIERGGLGTAPDLIRSCGPRISASAQNANALTNMFSGIMQSAMIQAAVQAAQAEWRNQQRSPASINPYPGSRCSAVITPD